LVYPIAHWLNLQPRGPDLPAARSVGTHGTQNHSASLVSLSTRNKALAARSEIA
jgi:hypothetical protein